MTYVKILLCLFLILSCKLENNEKKDKIKLEKICEIEEESEDYIRKIFMDSTVKDLVHFWYSPGKNNIKVISDVDFTKKQIQIDSLVVHFSDSLVDDIDLILTIKKINCEYGSFNFTTSHKSFSLDGEFKRISNNWKTNITANVVIN